MVFGKLLGNVSLSPEEVGPDVSGETQELLILR